MPHRNRLDKLDKAAKRKGLLSFTERKYILRRIEDVRARLVREIDAAHPLIHRSAEEKVRAIHSGLATIHTRSITRAIEVGATVVHLNVLIDYPWQKHDDEHNARVAADRAMLVGNVTWATNALSDTIMILAPGNAYDRLRAFEQSTIIDYIPKV